MYKIIEYSNGAKLIYKKMPDVSSVSFGIWFNTGSRNEDMPINGISHFLEHLVFKGSKNYTADDIKVSIEGVGGSLNAFTSEENTCYYAKFLAKHLKSVMKVLSDMVLCPLLKKEDIEKERTVIIEEIKMYKDLPQFQVQELFDDMMWPNHPLGRNIAGSIKSVTGIGRGQIMDYHASWYTPQHIVIACAGNLDEDVLEAGVKSTFSKYKNNPKEAFKPFLSFDTGPQVRVISKDIKQTHINLGFPGLNRSHEDRYALGLLNVILGGNMSSRLFNEVREKKGLAYEIASHVKKLKDTGAFFVHAGIDNKKLTDATVVIFKEFDRIRREKVSSGELRRAKDFFIAQSQMALDDSLDHMLWMGESLMNLGFMQTKSEMQAHIEHVTSADIQRLCKEILRLDRLQFAVVGSQGRGAEEKIKGMILKWI